MHRRVSAFNSYTIEAPDGKVGSVSDILFEDNDWKVRWFVIDTGPWLSGRRILVHPTALGRPDIRNHAFPVTLTKAQVEASPEISTDPPVYLQVGQNPSDYYCYGESFGGGFYGADGLGLTTGVIPQMSGWKSVNDAPVGDPHLRSLGEVKGYHIRALDGDIGHLDDFLVDDESWKIDHAIVDTKNWGFGKHVLVALEDIKKVDWAERYIQIDLTRYKIRCSPSWKEPDWSSPPGG